MSFLLDTNVVSEWARPRPDLSVIRWLDEVDEDSVFLSSLTLGELREGVDRLASGREHGLAVVTRNVRDFRDLGVRLVDPWTEAR